MLNIYFLSKVVKIGIPNVFFGIKLICHDNEDWGCEYDICQKQNQMSPFLIKLVE